MPALFFRKIAQELAYTGVRGLAEGAFVEALGFQLHQLHLLSNGGQSERAHEPDRFTMHKALDILPADERDVLAECLTVQLDKPMPVAVLFCAHFGKDL